MKHIYTLIIFVLLSASGFAQTAPFTLTFENSTVISQIYYSDSILDPAGIWQIGRPNKPIFDSAYASANAVVTLLDSALPPRTKASFTISFPGYLFSYGPGSILTFDNKMDLDTDHGQAYVEFTIDHGVHWHNIFEQYTGFDYFNNWCFGTCQGAVVDGQGILPPMWWHNRPLRTDTAGVQYFTGRDSTWTQDTIIFPHGCAIKTEQQHPVMFRFTVSTDSSAPPTAGWMIDNVRFAQLRDNCPGGINEINSSRLTIQPNPVESAYTLSLTDQSNEDYVVSLLDLTGREMMRRSFTGREVTLQRDGLAAGSYILKVTNTRTQDNFEKRVVFE